jgi:hypothetical protein
MKNIFKNWKTTTAVVALVVLVALQKFGVLTPDAANTLEFLLASIGLGLSADADNEN